MNCAARDWSGASLRPVTRHTRQLFGEGDRVVIATQAAEAGVDLSARLLITEPAPWGSLIQRKGRCNRRADIPDAEVLWVDIQPKDEGDELRTAPLTNASPQVLRQVKVEPEYIIRPVIRRRDLVDLFDTTPDLCGQDLDIFRYIRDGEDNDVQFFWRDIAGDAPSDQEPPARIWAASFSGRGSRPGLGELRRCGARRGRGPDVPSSSRVGWQERRALLDCLPGLDLLGGAVPVL